IDQNLLLAVLAFAEVDNRLLPIRVAPRIEEAICAVDRRSDRLEIKKLAQTADQRVAPGELGQLLAGELFPGAHPLPALGRFLILQPAVRIAHCLTEDLVRYILRARGRINSRVDGGSRSRTGFFYPDSLRPGRAGGWSDTFRGSGCSACKRDCDDHHRGQA